MAPSRVLLLTAAISVSVACQGRPVPLAAPVGSTVVIMLGDGNDEDIGDPNDPIDPIRRVGFGGPHHSDPQRGTLEFRLEDENGIVLPLRGTSAVMVSPTSDSSRTNLARGIQIVAVVDIPTGQGILPDVYDVYVQRIWTEGGMQLSEQIPYAGQLEVLPGTSSSTPLEAWTEPLFGSGARQWVSMTQPVFNLLSLTTPRPEVRLQFATPVWAAEIEITYPDGVIDILDVLEPPLKRTSNLARTWYTDDGQGNLSVGAIGGAYPIAAISFTFALDDTQVILDPAQVSAVVTGADFDGNPASPGTVSIDIF